MKVKALCFSALFGLAGCVSSADFYEQPFDVSFTDNRSYQQVYASTLRTMRACGRVSRPADLLGTATMNYESQLYADLGYGEIEAFMSGITVANYALMRIEREGSGSRVSIRTANMIAPARRRAVEEWSYWAQGGSECRPDA